MITKEELLKSDFLKQFTTGEELNRFLKAIFNRGTEQILQAEMDNHLGYHKNNIEGNLSGNSRNGFVQKKLKSAFEEIDLKVPRDRNGTFDPKIIPKRSNTRLGIENRNISLYAKGMTVSDIEQQLIEIYDVNISSSAITCTDNLNGFTSTINSVFPESKIQACVIHQIRNACKFISHKDRRSFTSGMKEIYTTLNQEAALHALDKFEDKLDEIYQYAIDSWRNNWTELTVFYAL